MPKLNNPTAPIAAISVQNRPISLSCDIKKTPNKYKQETIIIIILYIINLIF